MVYWEKAAFQRSILHISVKIGLAIILLSLMPAKGSTQTTLEPYFSTPAKTSAKYVYVTNIFFWGGAPQQPFVLAIRTCKILELSTRAWVVLLYMAVNTNRTNDQKTPTIVEK